MTIDGADEICRLGSAAWTHREQVERDLEQFAALAPLLGRDAQRETPLDVVIGVDPAFAGLVATTIVDGGWWLDDGAGVPWLQMVRKVRRDRIRRAARARKARRGWR